MADLAPTSSPSAARIDPLRAALFVTLGVTAVVTALSWFAPTEYVATLIAAVFLGATWWRVLRLDAETITLHGLALGGVLEPSAIDWRRLLGGAGRAVGWAALFGVIFFPPFFLGFRLYFQVAEGAHFTWPAGVADEAMGQLFVIALPEEAFFRGYLQTSLDARFPPRWRVFGVELGPGWVLTAAIFALGHLLTTPNLGRLAVFFPALAFGWLRARTGGIGAGLVFHASCNVVSMMLGRGYGLS